MRVLAFAGVLATAAAGQCDADAACSYSVPYKGQTYKYDLRGLCNSNADYVGQDDKGHNYYAQICGTTSQACLPADFDTYYMYGSAVQMWGSPPACDITKPGAACFDKSTGLAACCTAACQVIGLPETFSQPSVSLINADDVTQGIVLTMVGEQPTLDDPNSCSAIDPSTGQPVLRHTRFVLQCDASVKGFAKVLSVTQDETDNCLYTMTFATNVVCQGGALGSLSGGWVMVIITLVCGGVYLMGGSAFQYYRTKEISLPNAEFWEEANSLVVDGLLFIFSGFRKPARSARKGGLASMGKQTVDTAPLFGNSSDSSKSAEEGSSGAKDTDSGFGQL